MANQPNNDVNSSVNQTTSSMDTPTREKIVGDNNENPQVAKPGQQSNKYSGKKYKKLRTILIIFGVLVIAILVIAISSHFIRKHYAPIDAKLAQNTTNGKIAKNIASAVDKYVAKYSSLPQVIERDSVANPNSISLCTSSCAASIIIPSVNNTVVLYTISYTSNPKVYDNTFVIVDNALCNNNETAVGKRTNSNKAAILYTVPAYTPGQSILNNIHSEQNLNIIECLQS